MLAIIKLKNNAKKNDKEKKKGNEAD